MYSYYDFRYADVMEINNFVELPYKCLVSASSNYAFVQD